jgi:hypothetical protein
VPKFEWILSPKTAIDVALDIDDRNYQTTGFADTQTWSVPINLLYEVAPKLRGTAGYRFRDISQGGAADSTDHYFNVGARGEFTPKLTGSFTIGWTDREIDPFGTAAGRDDNTVGVESTFDYTISEKTMLRASIRNDFSNAATGATQEVFGLAVGLNSNLSEMLTANVSLSWDSYDYVGAPRTDDFWRFNLGAAYRYNEMVTLRGEYTYQDNSSDLAGVEFKNHIFSVSASIRY